MNNREVILESRVAELEELLAIKNKTISTLKEIVKIQEEEIATLRDE